jgi:hypothetical protein
MVTRVRQEAAARRRTADVGCDELSDMFLLILVFI